MTEHRISAELLLKANDLLYEQYTYELIQNDQKLKSLEEFKQKLPSIIAEKYQKDEDLSLTLDELVKLAEWRAQRISKMQSFVKTIEKNNSTLVSVVTKFAFNSFIEGLTSVVDESSYTSLVINTIDILTKLPGVGVATASLILSSLNKITKLAPPHFSEEAVFTLTNRTLTQFTKNDFVDHCLKPFYHLNRGFKYNFTDLEQGAWCLGYGNNPNAIEEFIQKTSVSSEDVTDPLLRTEERNKPIEDHIINESRQETKGREFEESSASIGHDEVERLLKEEQRLQREEQEARARQTYQPQHQQQQQQQHMSSLTQQQQHARTNPEGARPNIQEQQANILIEKMTAALANNAALSNTNHPPVASNIGGEVQVCRRCKKKRPLDEPLETARYRTCEPCREIERKKKRVKKLELLERKAALEQPTQQQQPQQFHIDQSLVDMAQQVARNFAGNNNNNNNNNEQ